MTPMDALLELSSVSTKGFWQPNLILSDNSILINDFLTRIRPVSAGLLLLFFLLEILRLQKQSLEGQGLSSVNGLFVWGALLSSFLLAPGLYFLGARYCIDTASYMGQTIQTADLQAMSMEVQNLMKGILVSTENPVSLFTSLLELFTPVGLLTAVSYYLVILVLYGLPYLQSMYLALLVALGPILLPFALFSPMRIVATKWFMSLLSCAFICVFGIIAYTAISVSGILTNLSLAGENHIPSLVFSFTTIVFLLSVIWYSLRIFGAISLSLRHGLKAAATLTRNLGAF